MISDIGRICSEICILKHTKKYMVNFEVGDGKWYNNHKYLEGSGNTLIFGLNFQSSICFYRNLINC